MSASTPSRPWWKLHFSTKVVIAIVVIGLVLANVPAQEIVHVESVPAKYGTEYHAYFQYVHGWPATYMNRPAQFGVAGNCWMLNDRVSGFSLSVLVLDFAVSLLVVGASAALFEFWRRRRKSLIRFHLSELFGLITIVAVGAGWLQYKIRNSRDERLALREAAADLQTRYPGNTLGDDAVFEQGGPTFLRELVGDYDPLAAFDHLVSSPVVDECPKLASRFPRLKCFQPNSSEMDDIATQGIAKLRDLEALNLLFAGIGPLSSYRPLPRLRSINLCKAAVTKDDLLWLARCPRLEQIDLTDVEISDEMLRLLLPLKKLKSLSVGTDNSSEALTDHCFSTLQEFSELTDLWVIGDFQGHQVGRLACLKELGYLGLVSPNLDGECIEQLKKLGHLGDIRLISTSLSADDVARLQVAIPNCRVSGPR